ncbi:hypothetical protein HK105_200404 [Polyrhizophydium stewartii]|uniref:Cytochrome P450 n=1 Tax=Polyrhizophydium stewartii TaxID=2732419 RepID=A0ABR4NLD2_9FUNG
MATPAFLDTAVGQTLATSAAALLVAAGVWLLAAAVSPAPRGPLAWPVVGNHGLIRRYAKKERLHKLYDWLARRYGGICQLRSFSRRTVLISEPGAARSVLTRTSEFGADDSLFAEGFAGLVDMPDKDTHMQHMAALKALPREKHLQRILAISMERLFQLLMVLDRKNQADPDFVADFDRVLKALSLDICGMALLSHDFESIAGVDHNEMNLSEIVFNKIVRFAHKRTTVDPFLWWYHRFGARSPDVVNVKAYFRNIVGRLIQERSKLNFDKIGGPVDALDAFVLVKRRDEAEMKKEAGKAAKKEARSEAVAPGIPAAGQGSQDKKASERDWAITGEVMGLLATSHMFLSSALSFVILELVKNPSVKAKLRAEVDAAWEAAKGFVQLETLQKLPVVDSVIREALRLHPVMATIARQSRVAVEVMGFKFPAATQFLINVGALHTDPKHWRNASEFAPGRWAADACVPGAFHPFGDDVSGGIEAVALVPLRVGPRETPLRVLHVPLADTASGCCQAAVVVLVRHLDLSLAPELPREGSQVDDDDAIVSGWMCRMRDKTTALRMVVRQRPPT